MRLFIVSASPRSDRTCPGQNGKTLGLARIAVKTAQELGVEVDFENISVKGDGQIIQPCKGCISTAGGFHCHYRCSCYGPGSAGEHLPDVMHDRRLYQRMERADGFLFFSPINWYAVSTPLKAMFDRMVCVSGTLAREVAFDQLGIKKDPQKSRAAMQSHAYDHLLKNWYAGKYAGFFVHGDDGADDFQRTAPPHAYESDFDAGPVNDPRTAVLPLVAQCRYSGIYVPDDCIIAHHANERMSYADANDNFKRDLLWLKQEASDLVMRLVHHMRKTKQQPTLDGGVWLRVKETS